MEQSAGHVVYQEWVRETSDANTKDAGRYDATAGRGLTREEDYGNAGGSILMLAMLDPETYGVPGAPRLQNIDDWSRDGMLQIQSGRPDSGKNANNRRTNVIEGLLND